MKAMILAAGRGERMRPLTDHTPKPLLPVAGKTIIEHTINQLVSAGFNDIIINHAHLGQQIEDLLGNGQQYGASIHYSPEGELGLETAGGIINALHLLGDEVFLVVNGDIATDFPFAELKNMTVDLAHLVLVDNPEHHPQGDFGLDIKGKVIVNCTEQFTFSGIGLYRPELFSNTPAGSRKLLPLLLQAIANQRVSGQKFAGFWMDIGTPERLQELNFYTQREHIMTDHIYKKIELTGSSTVGIQDAIEKAINKASQTIRDMRWFEVVETRGHIADGKVAHWQVTIKVGFALSE